MKQRADPPTCKCPCLPKGGDSPCNQLLSLRPSRPLGVLGPIYFPHSSYLIHHMRFGCRRLFGLLQGSTNNFCRQAINGLIMPYESHRRRYHCKDRKQPYDFFMHDQTLQGKCTPSNEEDRLQKETPCGKTESPQRWPASGSSQHRSFRFDPAVIEGKVFHQSRLTKYRTRALRDN
jgi:hypothetical protein